jgi:hypothetical protein
MSGEPEERDPEHLADGSADLEGRRLMGYGLIGILVIILLVVLIFYFVRRA